MAVGLTWHADLSTSRWNRYLAEMRGHPLQSSLWGDARRVETGLEDHRWAAFIDAEPILLARIEVRHIPLLGKVAWLPKGPALSDTENAGVAFDELLVRLRAEGFLVCVTDPPRPPNVAVRAGMPVRPKYPTVVLDLRSGQEALWNAIDKKTRHGMRASEKAGVIVEQTRREADVTRFFRLCESLSRTKHFDLPGSERLMQALCADPPSPDAEARLFIARVENDLAAGALLLRCGRSVHYFWGAMDRAFAKQHPSEAVQWGIIKWAIENQIETYDLEGIDRVGNPGTASFKLKLGGTEIDPPGRLAFPLGLRGAVALRVGQWLGKV